MYFAALRFYKDANISDKIYWYLCDFPVKAGDRVFAPVGVHDKVQQAVVERVAEGTAERAPYDPAFLKKVEGMKAAPQYRAGDFVFRDLGGIAYDEKHCTRFNRIYFCEEGEAPSGLFTDVIDPSEALPPLRDDARILIAGEGAKKYAERIIEAARGREHELAFVRLSRRLL